MDDIAFPITLARGMMRLMPPPVVALGAGMLLRRMGRSHPGLFANLAALPAKAIRVEPTDVPHRFLLRYGGGAPHLGLARRGDNADAVLKGELAALLALLEGRIDADTLFFSRAITVIGDTSAVVALHNTLDRENIDLLGTAMSLLGPLRGAGRAVALRVERRLRPVTAGVQEDRAVRERLRAEEVAQASRLAMRDVLRRRKAEVAL